METDPQFTSIASDPTSDRIAIGVVAGGSQNQVLLAVWDGAAWGDKLTATTSAWSGNSLDVAVGFESQSGELLATYLRSPPRRVTKPGPAAAAGQANSTPPRASRPICPSDGAFASDPAGDALMLGVQDSQSDLHYILWDGDTSGADNELTTNTGETGVRPFTFVFNVDAPPPNNVACAGQQRLLDAHYNHRR